MLQSLPAGHPRPCLQPNTRFDGETKSLWFMVLAPDWVASPISEAPFPCQSPSQGLACRPGHMQTARKKSTWKLSKLMILRILGFNLLPQYHRVFWSWKMNWNILKQSEQKLCVEHVQYSTSNPWLIEPRAKKTYHIPLYWLLNRDPMVDWNRNPSKLGSVSSPT